MFSLNSRAISFPYSHRILNVSPEFSVVEIDALLDAQRLCSISQSPFITKLASFNPRAYVPVYMRLMYIRLVRSTIEATGIVYETVFTIPTITDQGFRNSRTLHLLYDI